MHGKGDHVAGLRAWLTCRTDGLVGALPAQQSFLFSTVLDAPDGYAPKFDPLCAICHNHALSQLPLLGKIACLDSVRHLREKGMTCTSYSRRQPGRGDNCFMTDPGAIAAKRPAVGLSPDGAP